MSDTGTFELKPEFVEIVDPYYAHYSRNHREEAENVHKKHMARKSGKKPEEIVFEPKLQSLEGSLFNDLSAVTRTGLFASLIAAALDYAIAADKVAGKLQATRVETFLHMVLHLTLVAVMEDEGTGDNGFVSLAVSMQHSVYPEGSGSIVSMLLMLSKTTVYQSCQPSVQHILQKMQLQQPEKLSTVMGPRSSETDHATNESSAAVSAEGKEKKKQDALARQARVMAQMKQAQNTFIANAGLSGYDDEEFDDIEDDMSFEQEPENLFEQRKVWNFPTGTCILCQEATDDHKLYGTFAFLGESNILRSTPVEDPDFVEEVLEVPESLDQSADHLRPFGVAGKNKQTVQKTTGDGKIAKIERQGLSKGFPHAEHSTSGPVSSSCGHIMHYNCFEMYLTATQRRHQTQIARSQPETILLKEFICPLCKALGNTFLPIIWKGKQCVHEHELHAAKSFEDWLAESANTYAPDLSWLHEQHVPYHQHQQDQEACIGRSSEYVESTFGPVLAAALRDSGASDQSPAEEGSRYSLRRGLSLSSWFPRMERADPTQESAAASSGMNHSSGEPVPPAIELAKAYQRIDDTIRINKLGVTAQTEDSKINPVSPLSRALGFTISALEIQMRGTSANLTSPSLLGDLSEQSLTHLRIVSETIESYVAVNVLRSSHGNNVAREIALKKDVMSAQLFGVENEHTMMVLREFAGNVLLEDDMFLFFADWLAFFAPNVAEAPNILQMCLWAEIVKVIYVYKGLLRDGIVPTPDEAFLEDVTLTEDFATAVYVLSTKDQHESSSSKNLSMAQLKVLRLLVEKYAQTFLRKCVVLMHVRYGLDFECPYDIDLEAPELSRLTNLLHISSLDDLFEKSTSETPTGAQLHTLSHRWVAQVNAASEHSETTINIKLPHPTIYELVGLPKNYDTLTEEAIKRKCPTTGKEITDPAVCLFCAAIFCSQATCCMKGPEHSQRGGCWQHMQQCGGRVGIFINVRKCMVLFLHEPMSGSFAHAPYLDRHGEPDPTLRRHHQLFLNQKRYDKLMREVWLGHGIQTFISRKLEADINPGGWETL
jgi:E3 ubiquitin-protein ligase UBR1